MKTSRLILTLLLLAIAIGGAWFGYALYKRPAPVAPKEQVPPEWQANRQAPMHALHVRDKKIPCAQCHVEGVDKPAGERECARCHTGQAERAHVGGKGAATTCLTCHSFAAKTPAATCASCHEKTTSALRTPAPLAQHATAGLDCKACHDLHAPKGARAKLADCTSCHQGAFAKHAHADVAPQDAATPFDAAVLAFALDASVPADPKAAELHGKTCATCHAPHTPAKAALATCASCHANRKAVTAVAGHAACTSCHTPHAPGLTARASCNGCHANVHVLGEARAPEHAVCTNCHDPHRPAASPGDTCATCHSALAPKHPPSPKGACVGCHAPHPGGANASASTHATATLAASCTSCHKAANDRALHAGGLACTQCHRPHDFKQALGAGPPLCASCHGAIANAAQKNAGHAECKQCHGAAHTPNKNPACNTCHAREAQTAPKGHAACASCHESHSAALGAHAACASCHKDKPKMLHGAITGGCNNCHRPHGPNGPASPPACSSCHAPAKLPGLHAKPSHAECKNCHSGHGAPRSDRATCTTGCHQDRRTHQPAATACKGCHIFND